jgi:creatinine amidohydrolase
MEYREITDTGATGNAQRATPEKGQEAFRRFSEHIARGVLELSKTPVEVHNREFVDRVL